MKLEPLKKVNLPKYAAALGLIASAALLTGCAPFQTAGETAAPPLDSDDIVELAGEETVSTEPEQTTTAAESGTTELFLEGEAVPDELCTTEHPHDVPGSISIPEDDSLVLDGDVDVAYVPAYQEGVDDANRYYESIASSYADGFASKGFVMTRDSREFELGGVRFTAVLKNQERGLLLAYYDGNAEEQGKPMREWMQEQCAECFDWGCITEIPADADGYHRVIFVDMGRDFDDVIGDAEQIYKDVIA